jgi:hypothetical protein
MTRFRVLAIAVATGRIGYVLMIGDKLLDWGLSRKASKSPKHAEAQAKIWIDQFEPDVVITEKVPKTSTKSNKTRSLIEAIANVAQRAALLDVQVSKIKYFKNKYEEAAHFGDRFPDIALWVPRMRRLWEPEPRTTVLFEALALACVVIDRGTDF